MSAVSFYTSLNCPSCSNGLSPRYDSCNWISCSNCGAVVSKESSTDWKPGKAAEEDMSLLQIGTKGSWKEKAFEVTGRIRYEFEDESYVNWWHLQSAAKTTGWLADAYGELYFMQAFTINSNVASVEKVKIGGDFNLDEKIYSLISFSPVISWEMEGEVPQLPEDKLFMWVEMSRRDLDENGLDIHIYDRVRLEAFYSSFVTPESIHLTNIRKADGWGR